MKITKVIKLPLSDIDEQYHADLMEEVGDLIVNDILRYTNNGQSPVYGDAFDKLDPKYAQIKVSKGGRGIANLRLEGDLMAAVGWTPHSLGIEVGIMDDSQEGKADGHNNFSGQSRLPLRRFIPDIDETFHSPIMKKIDNIVSRYIELSKEDSLSELDLIDVLEKIQTTKSTAKKAAMADLLLEGLYAEN